MHIGTIPSTPFGFMGAPPFLPGRFYQVMAGLRNAGRMPEVLAPNEGRHFQAVTEASTSVSRSASFQAPAVPWERLASALALALDR